jgi:hypothetical protein
MLPSHTWAQTCCCQKNFFLCSLNDKKCDTYFLSQIRRRSYARTHVHTQVDKHRHDWLSTLNNLERQLRGVSHFPVSVPLYAVRICLFCPHFFTSNLHILSGLLSVVAMLVKSFLESPQAIESEWLIPAYRWYHWCPSVVDSRPSL